MSKKQGYSTVVCFVLTCIVAIIMFMNGLIVHAEELEEESNNSFSGLYGYDINTFGYWTYLGYQSSFFYNSSVNVPNDGYYSNFGTAILDTIDLSQYYETYPYFIFIQDKDSTNNTYLYLTDNPDCKVIFGNYKCGFFDVGNMIYLHLTPSNGVFEVNSVNSVSGNFALSQRQNDRFLFSNIDVYGSVGQTSSWEDLINSEYYNINYCLYDENGNLIYNNPITGGSSDNTYPDGSGGTILNNMYMETADWKFDIPVYWSDTSKDTYFYARQSNWGKGTVSFYGQINDYIIDHADDYEIQVDFYIKFNGKHNVPGVFDGDEPVMRSFAHSFAWRNVSIPLTEFINSNNLYSWSVDDIFTNALDSEYYNIKHYDDYNGAFAYYRNWDWTLSCSAHLVSGNYTSGNIQETYNFISMISKENSNTITENHNPYYPEDENGDPVIDEGDGNNSQVVTDGNGNIILTNNDNDNITINGNGEVAKDLYHEIIPSSGEGGLSESLQESFNTNGWLTVMRTVFSFVPEEVFDNIALYVISALRICVAGFALRIILDLL